MTNILATFMLILLAVGAYVTILRCPIFMCMCIEQTCIVMITSAAKISFSLQSNPPDFPLYLVLCVATFTKKCSVEQELSLLLANSFIIISQ